MAFVHITLWQVVQTVPCQGHVYITSWKHSSHKLKCLCLSSIQSVIHISLACTLTSSLARHAS